MRRRSPSTPGTLPATASAAVTFEAVPVWSKLAAALIGVPVIAACGSAQPRGRDPVGHRHPRMRARAAHAAFSPGAFRLGASSVSIMEPASTRNATTEGGTGTPARSLKTTLLYPAVGAPNGRENRGAESDVAHGPYPLVVFSQGFDVSAGSYSALADAWASAGYIVAAPTYPHTDPSDPSGVDEQDLVNHPADLAHFLRALLFTPPPSIASIIQSSEAAVVGQSDGGDVSLAVADNSCCRVDAVKAAAILSGAELASFGGTYYRSKAVPLLVVQGDSDTINPPACSAELYKRAPAPKYYLDLLGAEHLPPYLDAGTDQTIVERTTVDFFNGYLKHSPSGLSALAKDGSAAGATTITSAGSAPSASGSCPGAP
jgi:pimeloyl-ACP methyl ester carboxylesterase